MNPLPRAIYFSGLDGSGKTTLSEMLLHDLKRRNYKVRYVWMRYNHYITKPLLAYCRLIGLTTYTHQNGVKIGFHNFSKSSLISNLFIMTSLLDTKAASYFKMTWQLQNPNTIILCDRYVIDILIDLMIDTQKTSLYKTALGRFFLHLVPRNTKTFYVSRPISQILACRPELINDHTLSQRLLLYEKLARYCRLPVLKNDTTIEATYQNLLSYLLYRG